MLLRFDSPASGSEFILDVGEWLTPDVGAGGMIVAQVKKHAAASIVLTAGLGIDVTGAKAARRFDDPQAGLAWIFDEPTTITESGVAIVSGGGQVIANGSAGQESASGAAALTAGAGITAAIRKDAIAEWFVEFWVNLTTSVEKGAQSQPVVSGGGSVVAVGTKGTRASVTAHPQAVVVVAKGARTSAVVTGAGDITGSGFVTGPSHDAVITGGGTVTATGTAGQAKLGTVILHGGGQVASTTQKIAAVLAAISIGGVVQVVQTGDHSGIAVVSGGGDVSVVPTGLGVIIGEIELIARVDDVELTALVRT